MKTGDFKQFHYFKHKADVEHQKKWTEVGKKKNNLDRFIWVTPVSRNVTWFTYFIYLIHNSFPYTATKNMEVDGGLEKCLWTRMLDLVGTSSIFITPVVYLYLVCLEMRWNYEDWEIDVLFIYFSFVVHAFWNFSPKGFSKIGGKK